jgi:replicative DNA helicase
MTVTAAFTHRLNGHTDGHPAAPPVARRPPYAVELEEAVLGSALSDGDALTECADILTPADFFRASHAALWGVIVEMRDAGQRVDYLTLADELVRRGDRATADDLELFRRLRENSLPWNAVEHAYRLRELAKLRGCIGAAEDMLRDAYAREFGADEILSRCEDRLRSLAAQDYGHGVVAIGPVMEKARERRRRREAGQILGVSTPWLELNARTCGFEPGDLIVLGARPSMGKSALAMNVCEFLSIEAAEPRPSLFVSLEMGAVSLAERLSMSQSRVDGKKLRMGLPLSAAEYARLEEADRRIERSALRLFERPSADIRRIVSECRAAHRREPFALIAIDFVQEIEGEDGRDNRQEQITKITRRLKALARELAVPVLLCSQLNRQLENREDHRPRMSDLRESGAIEQSADIVLLLHRPEYYDPTDQPGVAEVNIAKQRNGEVGTFKLMFHKQFSRFEDMPEPAPPVEAFDRPY